MTQTMKRRCTARRAVHRSARLLGLALAIVFAGRAVAVGDDGESRPNIVFIIADDQPRKALGYLEGKALTPNIDRMAREGVNFSRAYVASSVCSPSRYTCLSGQYASRCSIPFFTDQATREGVTRVLWNVGFAPDQLTLPMALQRAGYTTGFVGKWHINGMPGWQSLPPGSDPASPSVKKVLASNQAAFSKGLKPFGFDFARNIYAGNPNDDKALVNSGLNKHNMEWVTQAGVEFIEQNRDHPFYLYFSPTLVHVPDPHASLTGDPRNSPLGMLDEPIMGVQPSRTCVIERCKAAGIPEPLWGANWLDDGVGALMKKLEELDLADNTLIVYFVDHGMEQHSKGTCYEGGLITPTLAYWPGHTKPQVCDEMIQNIDFAPTFLDLAGYRPPEAMEIDGRSFAPLLHGKPFRGHDAVYSEIGLTRAVSTPEWKYIAFHVPPSLQRTREERMVDHLKLVEDIKAKGQWFEEWELDPEARYYQMGMGAGGASFERWQVCRGATWEHNYFDIDQLYDLRADPGESKNLANDPQHAEKLAEMQALLKSYLDDLPGTYPGFGGE